MIDNEVLGPVVSTVAGGISVTGVAWLLIRNWLAKQDKSNDLVRDLDKDLAVLKHRVGTVEKDLNGLGRSMRGQGKGTPPGGG